MWVCLCLSVTIKENEGSPFTSQPREKVRYFMRMSGWEIRGVGEGLHGS